MTVSYSEDSVGVNCLEELRHLVEERQGVLTTTVRVVRDAYGAKKTGNQNRREISKALRDLGVGHFPAEFPTYQHEAVRLYSIGSPVADVIEAVLTPEPKTDGLLRQAAGGKAAEILKQIQGALARWS